jgi:hypothetical protein
MSSSERQRGNPAGAPPFSGAGPAGRGAGQQGRRGMTRGLGGHSPANITHHLKGLHFPVQKSDLLQQAKKNGAEADIMQVLEAMPEQEFASIAEVMKAMGEQNPDR